GTPNKQKVLSLADGAAVVMDGSDLITNIETSNGKERIETTMQADYTFGLGLKGYTWDTANGGKSPTNAELSTGTNWDLVANSIKASAGVLTIGDATK
ncbi:major capsid protein, partial [Klebsiella pneumoniae]